MAKAAAKQPDPEGSGNRLELRSVSKAFGSFRAVDSVSIGLRPGQMLALLGPSGCGKTTTLRMVAGLEQPTGGEIILDGEVLATGSRSMPPEQRGLGMVFQNYALWPHLSVFENVAYGLRRQRLAEASIHQRVDEVLRLAGMSGYADRSVTSLSGGQQQRVAVARALATRPKILLFDEPLSNLDALLRESMRFEIRSLQQAHGITAIYVTHSQEEALAIADVVAVMHEGRIQQAGPPDELYFQPRNRFVAGFIGLANILDASPKGSRNGRAIVALRNGALLECAPSPRGTDGTAAGELSIMFRPESVRMVQMGPTSSPAPASAGSTVLTGTVSSAVFTGNLIDYFVAVEGLEALIRVQAFPPAIAASGERVDMTVGGGRCVLLDD